MGYYTFTATDVPRQTKEFHESRWILNYAVEKKVDITVAIEIRGNHVEAVVNQAIHHPESRNTSVLTLMHSQTQGGLVNDRHALAHKRRRKTCTLRLKKTIYPDMFQQRSNTKRH